jgi:membrane dipeptidase
VAGGWFLWPHYCHHTRVLTIEDRVQHILTTTPLIGMIFQFDVIPTVHMTCLHFELYLEILLSRVPTNNQRSDGHDDFPIQIRVLFHNHINTPNFTETFVHGTLPGHVDLPRLKKGHVGGTFWSVYVPCPADWTDFSDENYAPSMFKPSGFRPF